MHAKHEANEELHSSTIFDVEYFCLHCKKKIFFNIKKKKKEIIFNKNELFIFN